MALIKRDSSKIALEEPQNGQSREELLLLLNSPNSTDRRSAARELTAHEDISEELLHRLEIEDVPAVRGVLFSSLTLIGDTKAVTGLLILLHSEDAELRNSSIEALKCLPEKVAAHIDSLLSDEDPDIRIFAVNILESFPHPNVPGWLLRVIEEEKHVNVCAAAVDLLTELGTPDMVPALFALKVRFEDSPFIAFAVDLAIERITGSTSIELPA